MAKRNKRQPDSDQISEKKLKKLEDVIRRLAHPREKKQIVKHQNFYNPFLERIENYRRKERLARGSGVDSEFLHNLYEGVRQAGEYILHIAKPGGLATFRKDFRENIGSMDARIEYTEALFELAYAASDVVSYHINTDSELMEKKKELDQKQVTRYGKHARKLWRDVKTNMGRAAKCINGGRKLRDEDRTAYQKYTKAAFEAYQSLDKISFKIVDMGITDLTEVVGPILWTTKHT